MVVTHITSFPENLAGLKKWKFGQNVMLFKLRDTLVLTSTIGNTNRHTANTLKAKETSTVLLLWQIRMNRFT